MGEHKDLSDVSCPICGGSMDDGFIAGQYSRLRWVETAQTKTILSGTPLLKKRDLWNAPTLPARRCTRCKVGVFAYDN